MGDNEFVHGVTDNAPVDALALDPQPTVRTVLPLCDITPQLRKQVLQAPGGDDSGKVIGTKLCFKGMRSVCRVRDDEFDSCMYD